MIKKGYQPDFLESNSQGYELSINENAPDNEFAAMFYFVQVNGKYKLYAIRFAG